MLIFLAEARTRQHVCHLVRLINPFVWCSRWDLMYFQVSLFSGINGLSARAGSSAGKGPLLTHEDGMQVSFFLHT